METTPLEQTPPSESPKQLTEADINELRMKVVRIERGELPQDAVTTDELKLALEFYRNRYRTGGLARSEKASAKHVEVDLSDVDL